MLIDNNLIAYEFYKNQYVPKEIYYSGEKEETKLLDKYNKEPREGTILVIENDIVNEEGYGLKKGFYNVKPDKYLDFLLIYQSYKLKAKVPIIKTQIHESIDARTEKVEKMSYKKYLKEKEKEYRKYLKGENPKDIEWTEAQIYYIPQNNSYLLIYNSNILELHGIIKF
ncbi:MAG: hypothetical protein IJ003_04290 [Candidatus Gastranaerophilales bacterium]|nr:hypothetical protein [Candidatus Gastranaerophilales bacterium]